MNVYRHGNVIDVCTFRPRFVLRRRSSRLEVQDECYADPYCPDFIASWHSQLGRLAMHPTRIAQNATGIIRPAAEIALFSSSSRYTRSRSISSGKTSTGSASPKTQITCGLAQPTAGEGRMTCATINYTRSDRGTVITIQSLRRWRHPARNEKIRADPIPDLLRCNRKCASGDLASVATNCEYRRSAGA